MKIINNSSKKKLAHLQLLPILSGVQNMMLSLLAGLDRKEYDIFVISKPSGPLVDAVKKAGYTHIPLNALRRNISLWDIPAFFKLIFIFKSYKFDIVHTHSSKTGFLGRIAAKIAGVPRIIHTIHGFPFNQWQSGLVRNFYINLEKIAAGFADFNVTMNNEETDLAKKYNIIKSDKIKTIYNGIQIDRYRHNYTQKDKIIIGWVARFAEQKNPVQTLKAIIKYCQSDDKIDFVFVGDGELFKKCRDMVISNQLEDRINLVGWQSDIQTWLKKFDLFLAYSKFEGLSISVMEAMATGLPIIGSHVRGINDLVSDKNGYLIKPDSPEILYNFLLTLPTRQNELETKGHNSVKIIKEKFSYEKFITSYKELYEF